MRWRTWNVCGAIGASVLGLAACTLFNDLDELSGSTDGGIGADGSAGSSAGGSAGAVQSDRPVFTPMAGLTVGGTLTKLSDGLWTGQPAPTFSSQHWQTCDGRDANGEGTSCVDIAAATSDTLTLTQAEVGSCIRIGVTYSTSKGKQTEYSLASLERVVEVGPLPSLTRFTGFETATLSDSGVGSLLRLFDGFATGNMSIVSEPVHSGSSAVHFDNSGAGASNNSASWSLAQPVTTLVGRVYVSLASDDGGTLPTIVGSDLALGAPNIAFSQGQLNAWFWDHTLNTTQGYVSGQSINTDTWYRIDWRFDTTGSSWTIEWQVDGVDQPIASWAAGTSQTMSALAFGVLGGGTKILDLYMDDLALSTTAADYPLGAGTTLAFAPNSVGAHELAAKPAEVFFSSSDDAQTRTPLASSDTTSFERIRDWPVEVGASADLVGVEVAPLEAELDPVGESLVDGWHTESGATTGLAASIDDYASGAHDGDSSYIEAGNKTNSDVVLLALGDTAADFDPDKLVSIELKSAFRKSSGSPVGGPDEIRLRFEIVKADGTTPLTSNVLENNVASSWTENSDGLSVQGTSTKSDWDGAQLKITQDYFVKGPPDPMAQGRVSAASVRLLVATSTGEAYLEHGFADSTQTAQPIAINVIHALRALPEGSDNRVSAKLSDDGVSFLDLYADQSVDATLGYALALLPSKPSGGPWTNSSLSLLIQRWGYIDSSSASVALDAALIEVAFK